MKLLPKRLGMGWCVVASMMITGGVGRLSWAGHAPISAPPAVAPRVGATLSSEDFQLFMQWRTAQEDSRFTQLSPASKLQKIAQIAGVDVRRLQHAIAAGEKAAPTLDQDVEQGIRTALKSTPLAGDVLSIDINTDHAHVVAGIKWRCGPEEDREKEAAYVAWAVSEGCTLVNTLALWCVSPSNEKLFSAKIGRSAFERISLAQIPRFAVARYIRLFEDVRRGPHHDEE